jgi:hypothetical protein
MERLDTALPRPDKQPLEQFISASFKSLHNPALVRVANFQSATIPHIGPKVFVSALGSQALSFNPHQCRFILDRLLVVRQ